MKLSPAHQPFLPQSHACLWATLLGHGGHACLLASANFIWTEMGPWKSPLVQDSRTITIYSELFGLVLPS